MQELIREPINTNLLQRYIDEWLSHVNTTHNWKRLHQILSNLLMGVVSATDTHIGSTDLTLTSNRTLAGAGYNFTINNVANLLLSATTDINLTSANQLHITLPSTATAPVGAPLLNTLYGMGVMELAGYGFPTSLTVVDDNKMLVYNHISKAFVTQTQPSAVGGFTPGSVLFADTDGSITEDNSQLFWDKTNNYFGIGTAVPSYRLDVTGNTRLGQTNAALGLESAVVVTHLWNDAGVTPTTLLMSATDTLSPSNSLIIQALVNLTSIFKVRKDGRITTAETVEFTNTLTQQTTPTGFLTLSGSNNGTIQYSTVGNLQTALGIDAAALTAGYIAYGTGSGITGESGFFYNTTDNRMGLGTDTPMTKLNVVDTINTSPRGILSSQYSTDTSGARVGFSKARGTVTVPTVIVTGDVIGSLVFRGYDGTFANYVESASIEVVSTGTIASATGRVPSYMTFSTSTDTSPSVLTERMRITSAGFVGIATTPSYALDILSSSIGATSGTLGAQLQNNTVASAGSQQYSPSFIWKGNGWKTADVAASQSVEFYAFVETVQGSASPSGKWVLRKRINGVSPSEVFSVTSSGAGSFPSSVSAVLFTGRFETSTGGIGTNFTAFSNFINADAAGLLGSASTHYRCHFGGFTTSTMTANLSAASVIFGASAATIAASGTHPLFANVAIRAMGITAGAGTLTNSATLYIEGAATAATNNYTLWVDSGTSRFGGRVQFGHGAAVASAATTTLGNDGNLFHITGTTNIDNISTTNWQAGSKITLIFDGVLTVGDGTGNMILAGNFTTAANSTLCLIYDGTSWFELSRSTN